MAKPYLIRFWHGMSGATYRTKAERELVAKLESICGPADGVNNIFFNGPLEDFAVKYNGPFLFYPACTDNEKEYTSGNIWVTQHGNFSAR